MTGAEVQDEDDLKDVVEDNYEAGANADDDVRAAIAQLSGDQSERNPDTRTRDDFGRFASSKVDEKVEAKQKDDSAAPVVDLDSSPASWKAELKEKFKTLPPEIKQEIMRRESDMDNGGKQWAQEKQNLLSHFEPLRDVSARYNISPGEAIKRLVGISDFLDRDPAGAIQFIAQAYGVQLGNHPAGQSPQSRSAPAVDPRYDSIQTELQTLRGFYEAQEKQAVDSSIADFAKQPGREHFESVKTEMGELMLAAANLGKEMTLAEAYERAIWSNPETRAKMMAAQPSSPGGRQVDLEKARRGAISAKGGPASGIAPSKPDTSKITNHEDYVRLAIEQLANR